MPQNEGEMRASIPEKGRWLKVYDLELANMEGNPAYALKHQLSFGSEIGNVIVADSTVSPRHCTFILQQDVISVIDHGSVSGTQVNGKKIPSGKYIILEESDEISIGDLQVRINARNELIDESDIPDIELDSIENSSDEDEEEVVVEREEKKEEKHKSAITTIKPSTLSTNSLVRVLAVASDLLLSYTIITIFYPFDEFKMFLQSVPEFLKQILPMSPEMLWNESKLAVGPVAGVLEEGYQFFNSVFHAGPLITVFFVLRFFSTLLLGVSFSEKMFSVSAEGNIIWSRIGGALRVVIGMVTWPLIVFDLPAILSKRTLKEMITVTKTVVSSKFVATVAAILYLPLLVVVAITAPLIQGLELPEPIIVNDRIEQRTKVVQTNPEEGAVPALNAQEDSRNLRFQLQYNPNELSVIPHLSFKAGNNKTKYNGQLVFYHKDLQRFVEMELVKEFDLKQLLGIGLKGNFFLFDKFQNIYNYVYAVEGNTSFKAPTDEKAQAQFANEVISYIKVAMEFDVNNAFENMQTYSPIVKNFVDFKASFLGLLEYKGFDEISFMKLGNVIFLRVSYMNPKAFDLMIPLTMDHGRMFKISYDKKESLTLLKNKFYKSTLANSDWLLTSHSAVGETMTAFQVYDFFQSFQKKSAIEINEAQAIYGYFYEKSAKILGHSDLIELDLWAQGLTQFSSLIKEIDFKMSVGNQETPWTKLSQNFQDMESAFTGRNRTYFGLEQNTTL